MAIADSLDHIKAAIQSGDKSYARELLKDAIRNSPSAEVWYLASKVASSKDQSISFLQKALDLDPFHEPSNAALERLQDKPQPQPVKRKNREVAADNSLLTEAVAVFVQNDWEIKMQMNNMANLEKREAVRGWVWVFIIFLLGWFGCMVVAFAISTSKRVMVILKSQPDGSLRVTCRGRDFVVKDVRELRSIAGSLKSGMTYQSVIMWGVISTVILIALSMALTSVIMTRLHLPLYYR